MKQLNLNRKFRLMGFSTKNRKAGGVTSEILFAFMLLLSSSMNGQQNPNNPYQDLVNQSGLGGVIEQYEGYIAEAQVFYSLPEGVDESILDDMEYTQMRSYRTGERKMTGSDINGNPFSISKVLDPEVQFLPQVLPYDMSIMSDGFVKFLDFSGDEIYKVYVGIPEFESLPPPSGSTNPNIPGLEILPQPDGSTIYRMGNFEQLVNPNTGLLVTTELDGRGGWVSKSLSFEEVSDTLRSVPLFEMFLTRENLISGTCVFRAELISYSDYVRKERRRNQNPVKMEIEDIAVDLDKISYYPNPAGSSVQIDIPDLENVGEVDISLITMDGKTVYQNTLPTNANYNMDLQSFGAGIYILRFDSNGQTVVNKLIIK